MRENIKLAEVISADIKETRCKLIDLMTDLEKIRDEWYFRYEPFILCDEEDEMIADCKLLYENLQLAYDAVDDAERKLKEGEEAIDEFTSIANDAVL